MYKLYKDFLSTLENTAKIRTLPEPKLNHHVINFASNDYLQLSKHPQVIKSAKKAIDNYGAGATGARLLSGNYPIIEEFECQIAQDKNTEAALIFPSGFQANISVLAALIDPQILKKQPLVFFDKLNHASLYQALKIHNINPLRYRHLDLNHLESLLQKYQASENPKFIVSETIFGMDGDQAELKELINLCERYQAFLYLDEAHATGMFGPRGYGLTSLADLSNIPHIIMGSFSKALGSQGGYIACTKDIKNYLINKCQGFIYSTACAPAIIGAAFAAWRLIPELGQNRKHILKLSQKLHNILKNKGLDYQYANAHIQPLLLNNAAQALELKAFFAKYNINCSAIRPPTVPTARLRFAINAGIQDEDLNHLIEVIQLC